MMKLENFSNKCIIRYKMPLVQCKSIIIPFSQQHRARFLGISFSLQTDLLPLMIGVQSSFLRPVEYGDPNAPFGTRNPLQVYPASNIDAARRLLVVSSLCISMLFEVQSRSCAAHTSLHDLPLGPNIHLPSFKAIMHLICQFQITKLLNLDFISS